MSWPYWINTSCTLLPVVVEMAKTLDVSIDELIFGAVSERMEKNISDRELLSMFQKAYTRTAATAYRKGFYFCLPA